MKKFVFIILILLLTVVLSENPASTQQSVAGTLANLRANEKLHGPDKILSDFINGQDETAVIILLQPTTAAKSLAGQSKVSGQVSAEFTVQGAPTYYNLQDESIKRQLKATVTETVDRFIERLEATGIKVTHRFSYQFGFAALVTAAALEKIVNWPDVVTVEKDSILQAHLAQGIPLMNASTVRSTYKGSGISIAICDTGIDYTHPKLGGGSFPNAKVIGGYDTGDNDADPKPDRSQPHGTSCAGIAAGDTAAVGDYIGGVASDAKLYAIKISSGSTGNATSSAMIAGWEWVVTHKNDNPSYPIMIISTSFGGGQYYSTCDSESTGMTTAAANAVAAGITIFVSSGNDGYCDSMAWPACISYVNSVGAVYDASFGVYEPCVSPSSCAVKQAGGCSTGFYASDNTAADKVTSYSNSASFLTLLAPSNNAYTTNIVGSSSGDYDSTFGGTSAACPYAAGAAAVLQQAAKAKTGAYLTPAQVKTYLVNNGDLITDGKVAVTKPRINLDKAVKAIPLITLAPIVTTTAASGITTTGATLNGTVNANNDSTTVTFEYGLTTGYGTTVTADQSPVSGTTDTAVSKGLTGLTPNTIYHYWVVGVNSAGTSFGTDGIFRTHSTSVDFNGDGKSDILWRNSSNGAVYIWLMNGQTIASQGLLDLVPLDWQIQGTGDFNGDGKLDILWRHSTTGQLFIWLMNGLTISAQDSPGTVADPNWQVKGVGDLNGDGSADILWRNSSTGEVYVWLMNSPTITSEGSLGVIPLSWQIIDTGDFDGDGKADILWRNSSTGEVYVWLMNGQTITSEGSLGVIPLSWQFIDTGDFDGDEKSDILWRHAVSGLVYIWLMNGTTIASQGSPGMFGDLGWQIKGTGDVNGDDKSDILWRNSSSGQVFIWLMNGLTISAQGSPGTVSDDNWIIAAPQ